jgi:two-component system sensor histidine kinase AtoS
VDVIVRDAGRGLHPDELAVAFEPGFRVRNGQVGATWGLFSSRQIVREHGGDMQIRSTPGSGTEVTVSLPLELGLEQTSS